MPSPRPVVLVAVFALLVAAACSGSGGAPIHTASPSAGPSAGPTAPTGGAPATATIETSLGPIVIALTPETAPIAVANFVKLAESGYYDDVIFHRLVPDFIIQAGDGQYGKLSAYDPARVGFGGPGYTIKDEPVIGDYVRGAVAMARTSEPDSAGSQFFICLADLSARLPKSGGYVIFGQVVSGIEVVDAIAAGPNSGNPDNRALTPVAMTRVTISPP
jgi:cyclophilin family peptidyl-prolyl cis-trans isomerase